MIQLISVIASTIGMLYLYFVGADAHTGIFMGIVIYHLCLISQYLENLVKLKEEKLKNGRLL